MYALLGILHIIRTSTDLGAHLVRKGSLRGPLLFIIVLNPSPAEPSYALYLQTV